MFLALQVEVNNARMASLQFLGCYSVLIMLLILPDFLNISADPLNVKSFLLVFKMKSQA